MKTAIPVVAAVSLLLIGLYAAGVFSSDEPSVKPVKEEKTDTPEPSPIQAPRDDVMLSPEKQQEIWDAEHITFQLEKKFGKAFRAALADGNEVKVRSFFREDFTGAVIAEKEWHETIQEPLAAKKRTSDGGTTEASLDAVIAELMSELDAFKQVTRHNLRVLQIKNLSDDLWECRLLVVLVGVGKAAPHVISESEHITRFVIEDKDALATATSISGWTFDKQSRRSSSRALMEEVTKDSGLARLDIPDNWITRPREPHFFQMGVEDFDLDGDPDIAIATTRGKRFIMRNDDGKFVNATLEVKIARQYPANPKHSLSFWFDYDNDGYPDLLSGSELFHNEGGKEFSNVTRGSGLKPVPTCVGAAVADFDNDGYLDLYLLNHAPLKPERNKKASWVSDNDSGVPNDLWRNKGDGTFELVSNANAGGGKRASHSAVWFHYNDDVYPDLYVANDFGKNVMLQNNGDGTFADISAKAETDGYSTSMGTAVGDINNDGESDLYVSNMYSKMGRRIIGMVSQDDYPADIYEQICGSCAGNRLYLRKSDDPTKYYEVGEDWHVNNVGWAWGPAMVDLDSDGWLDLYATTGYMSATRGLPDG